MKGKESFELKIKRERDRGRGEVEVEGEEDINYKLCRHLGARSLYCDLFYIQILSSQTNCEGNGKNFSSVPAVKFK